MELHRFILWIPWFFCLHFLFGLNFNVCYTWSFKITTILLGLLENMKYMFFGANIEWHKFFKFESFGYLFSIMEKSLRIFLYAHNIYCQLSIIKFELRVSTFSRQRFVFFFVYKFLTAPSFKFWTSAFLLEMGKIGFHFCLWFESGLRVLGEP